MPWVPLTRIDGPPGPVLQECRRVIDERARPDEHDNLLAVTQALLGLQYNDPGLLAIFGGEEATIESPVLQNLLRKQRAEACHKLILRFLEDRFGPVSEDVATGLKAIPDEERLDQLGLRAAECPDLNAFWQQLGPR